MSEDKKKEKSKHPFRDLIEVVVFAVVMALGLKVFAIEAYQIPTGSMMPTLMGTGLVDEVTEAPKGSIHDRVLVDKLSFLLRDPLRWEVVVFRYPLDTHTNYVKRLVGMPGEELWVREGDLYRRDLGSSDEFTILRKPMGIQNKLWKRCWPTPGVEAERWTGWNLTGSFDNDEGRISTDGRSRLKLAKPIVDFFRHGYPDAIYNRIPRVGAGISRQRIVGDLRVATDLRVDAESSPLEIRMEAGAYPVQLDLDPVRDLLLLTVPTQDMVVEELPLSPGTVVEVDLAFWDHRVRCFVEAGGKSFVYEQDLELEVAEPTRNGVQFFTEQGGWTIDSPTLWRDVHYLSSLQSSYSAPFEIAEGHYFMMGDNTQTSHDSRDWEARVIEPANPDEVGIDLLRGDNFAGSVNPFTNNPRWNGERTIMTFRNEHGEMFTVPNGEMGADREEPAPLVPRRNIIGKAQAVFLPIPPLAPTWRIKVVR